MPRRHFYLYDVFKGEQIRKIYKKDVGRQKVGDSEDEEEEDVLSDEGPEVAFQSDAFDADPIG